MNIKKNSDNKNMRMCMMYGVYSMHFAHVNVWVGKRNGWKLKCKYLYCWTILPREHCAIVVDNYLIKRKSTSELCGIWIISDPLCRTLYHTPHPHRIIYDSKKCTKLITHICQSNNPSHKLCILGYELLNTKTKNENENDY